MSHRIQMATGSPHRRWKPSASPPDAAAETLAAARVLDLCRCDAALSMRVFRLRHDPNTLTPTWRAVLAIIEGMPK